MCSDDNRILVLPQPHLRFVPTMHRATPATRTAPSFSMLVIASTQ
jgi:hypothetical protein